MWTSDKMKAAHTSLAAATLFSSFASAVEYLSISGANFVSNSTGDRFDIIGVTYERNPQQLFTTSQAHIAAQEAQDACEPANK